MIIIDHDIGMRKRPSSGANLQKKEGSAPNSILKFYGDDSPGLKITPVVVLVMSVCFIGFVTILHAMSKIYQYKMS
jgi:protein transport protein SEC61 subunit beta